MPATNLQPNHRVGFSLFFVLLTGLVLLALNWSAKAKEFTYTASTTQSTTPSPMPLNLLIKIDEAKRLLRSSAPLRVEKIKVGKNYQVNRKQLALAILDTDSGNITEHRFWLKEAEIKNYSKTRIINLTAVNVDENLLIAVNWWNSFNSVYEVVGHPNMFIIANKYPLLSKYIPDPKARSSSEYTDIVYVPYSEALQTPELVQTGKDYIKEKVDTAFASLQANRVKSRSVPGQLVSDVVNKDFLKNIIVVEHVDPTAFAIASDDGKSLTDRVLVIIGTNRENAYAYTGSPAGANGIAQFIPSTYRTMRLTYPSAKLIPDFLLGTATHDNALKAMALFFDAYKREITDKITRKKTLAQIGGVSEEMMSMAYNGGPNRVVRAVNTYGSNWLSSQFTASLTKVFRPETLGYIAKFQSIRDLHIF